MKAGMAINGDYETLIQKKKPKKKKSSGTGKSVAFVVIGGLTLIYCIGELVAALYLSSLTLLSDGFHNLSDVVSLYIAFWAQTAAQRDLSKEMSYGWARTEILGGLTNGCFLLSLCLYVGLEAIPRLIQPETSEQLTKQDGGYLFIGIAGVGLILNILGTIVFAAVGISHGHSHSHGHGHGHGHGHKDPAALEPMVDGGHSHAEGDHDHEHSHDHDHKKKDKPHNHSEVKEKKKKKDHSHSHGDKSHKHDKHDHKRGLDDMDMNTKAVFLHFLGDAISSLCVLGTGLVLHFFSHAHWIKYLDPISSLVIVIIIITTTVPLVKRCSMILLQSVPSEIDLDAVTTKTLNVDGVVSVHDLHVWQLVDGMIIASVHLMVTEGADVGYIVYQVKQIFHSFGIHSSAIQPEFVKSLTQEPFCVQNCVEECEADWCCKKTADKKKDLMEDYSTFNDV